MDKKTIIVFGATGKVGCYTALYLKECGYDVIATGKRNKSKYDFRYEDIKKLGYRSLINEYYKQNEKNGTSV